MVVLLYAPKLSSGLIERVVKGESRLGDQELPLLLPLMR
jgi:hypothetical protein